MNEREQYQQLFDGNGCKEHDQESTSSVKVAAELSTEQSRYGKVKPPDYQQMHLFFCQRDDSDCSRGTAGIYKRLVQVDRLS